MFLKYCLKKNVFLEIGWEEHQWNNLFYIELDIKPVTPLLQQNLDWYWLIQVVPDKGLLNGCCWDIWR